MQGSAGAGTPPKEDLPSADSGESPVWSPRVIAEFMTRIDTDDAPWSPNGIAFHSNCPSCDRNLVFHTSILWIRTER